MAVDLGQHRHCAKDLVKDHEITNAIFRSAKADMNQCTSAYCNRRYSKPWSAVISPISRSNLCFLLRVGVFTLVLSRSSNLGAMIPSAVTTTCAILQLSDRHCTGMHHAARGGMAGPISWSVLAAVKLDY